MKLDKHVVDMFTELTKPADDIKMEKTCYGTISVVDGTRYVKLDGSDLLVPAASTVKTSHGDRVTVLMKNHSLTVTGNLTAPATDGEGGSSGEAGTAATIEVGTVTTGEAGSSASVTNSGTTSAAVFDFVIPRGDKGEKGDTGPQGPQGEKGDTGTWDGTIPDHEHTVSDIMDFPTSLPANGGNADTLDGLHANEIAINPNLLINPDFRINQRGSTSYSSAGYSVDGWKFYTNGSGNSGSYDAKTHVLSGSVLDTDGYYANMQQYIEEPARFAGKVMTLSASMLELNKPALIQVWRTEGTTLTGVAATSYNLEPDKVLTFTMPSDLTETSKICTVLQTRGSVKLNWAKLEQGSIATPFCPPDPATELAKCQRYAMTLESLTRFHSTLCNDNVIDFFIPTSTTLRTTPTIPTDGVSMRVRDAKNHSYTGFSLIVLNVSSNGFVIRATKENHGLTEAILEIPNRLIISAEL